VLFERKQRGEGGKQRERERAHAHESEHESERFLSSDLQSSSPDQYHNGTGVPINAPCSVKRSVYAKARVTETESDFSATEYLFMCF